MSDITLEKVASQLQDLYRDYATGKLIRRSDILSIVNESYHQIDEMVAKQQKNEKTKRIWAPSLRMELRNLRLKRLREVRDFVNKDIK